MKIVVNIVKTKACIKPTKISKNINGKGIKYGAKKKIIVNSTSPAKTFPKSLKVKEIIRADIERYKLENPEEKQGK